MAESKDKKNKFLGGGDYSQHQDFNQFGQSSSGGCLLFLSLAALGFIAVLRRARS